MPFVEANPRLPGHSLDDVPLYVFAQSQVSLEPEREEEIQASRCSGWNRTRKGPGKDEGNLKCCSTEMRAGKCPLVELAKGHDLVLSEMQLEITPQGVFVG